MHLDMIKYIFVMFMLVFCIIQQVIADDNTSNDTLQVGMYVKINKAFYKGDSIPNITLHTFYKNSPMVFKNQICFPNCPTNKADIDRDL